MKLIKQKNIIKRILFLSILLIFSSVNGSFAQERVINIWPSNAPGTEDQSDKEKIVNERVYNVYQPSIKIFLAEKQNIAKAGVLIFPGGGYSHLAIISEGEIIAKWLNSLGINAFVLKYRLNQKEALEDALRAMSFIRSKVKDFNLDPDNIGVIGFSAGGHLALNLAEHFNKKKKFINDKIDSTGSRANFMILAYPDADSLASKKYMNKELPHAFLIHADDDKRVPVEISLTLFNSLHSLNIPVEMHIFKSGGHGFGLGKNNSELSAWPSLCKRWMFSEGIIK